MKINLNDIFDFCVLLVKLVVTVVELKNIWNTKQTANIFTVPKIQFFTVSKFLILLHFWHSITLQYPSYTSFFLAMLTALFSILKIWRLHQLKCGFLKKSFIMNAPLWVEHLNHHFLVGLLCCTHQKVMRRCSTHKGAFIVINDFFFKTYRVVILYSIP